MPHNYYFKGNKRKNEFLGPEKLLEIENDMKYEFSRNNKSIINIFRRINSRKNMYFNNPKIIVDDIKKFIKWY